MSVRNTTDISGGICGRGHINCWPVHSRDSFSVLQTSLMPWMPESDDSSWTLSTSLFTVRERSSGTGASVLPPVSAVAFGWIFKHRSSTGSRSAAAGCFHILGNLQAFSCQQSKLIRQYCVDSLGCAAFESMRSAFAG